MCVCMCVCIDWVWFVWLSPTLGQMRVFSTAVLPFARQIELLICSSFPGCRHCGVSSNNRNEALLRHGNEFQIKIQ